jgi:ATP-dependent helicase Lhr and Lhr-like helicase
MPVRSAADPALALFHPVVQEWFAEEVGTPTDVQRRAWPEVAAGRHVLVTAPTGTGKTLTAFLWALDRFFTGALETGATRVLYVSPLKALNADIRRNLAEPSARLAERFQEAGLPVPGVRALTRSGDTPQGERQKMLRRPPEILITTPESLNILLTSRGGRSLLGRLETVILDEIHAVAGSKRGTHLMSAVERLVPLSGEFQRIALSATVRPLTTVADFVGGFEAAPGPRAGEPWSYRKRPVTVVRSEAGKVYDLRVRFAGSGDLSASPLDGNSDDPETSVWDRIVPELEKAIRRNRSTLVFANSRRTTEKLTRMLNAGQSQDLAYSHHGSLSREVRQVVEERLKRGELPAIVATSSLELGIDIGALDEVILVQTPPTAASAIQRLGRAGHRVGEVSRGTLLPTHGRDLLSAAVVARAVLAREIEAVRPPEAPLDVLAQVILSMTATEGWDLEELFGTIRGMWPYRNLPRRHFDLVLEMLSGRYADSRIRELAPRVTVDRVEGTVRARPGAERLVYLSGGTIPDRGYFSLRVETGGAAGEGGAGPKIGELDEEFVWERSVGDTFTLGTQIWRVRRITHNDVFVEAARGSAAMAPFWRADLQDREFFLAERIGRFLEAVEDRLELEDEPLLAALSEELVLDRGAAAELVRFLRAGKAALGGRLPHRHRLMVEHVAADEGADGRPTGPDGPGRSRMVLHTFWGGRVNRPLALALSAAWEERYGARPEILQDDDCLMVTVPASLAGEDLLALLLGRSPGAPDGGVEELLRSRLEATGFFGALFRQNAARALLLPRTGFRHRTPLWLTRQRSKQLLEALVATATSPWSSRPGGAASRTSSTSRP